MVIEILDSSDTNFVIPVYQRNYDWKKEQCKQLYDDLVNVVKYDYKSHFFGTIVSIYNDSSRDREYLIIDGQQRITTVSLMLLAIYNILDKGRLESNKIRKEKIYNQYLVNPYMDDDSKLKLKPIKDDRKVFENIFNDEQLSEESNISANYKYFYERIIDGEISLDDLYSAIEKLMIVEIELKNGEDDPQLIFESLNSTGLDLTDADKVRNFILMDKTSKEQEDLYNNYWNKVEKNTLYNVTSFLRDYMTVKERRISNINKVYINFKSYIKDNDIDIKDCLKDILKYSEYYNKILTSNTGIKEADDHLQKINKLEVRVSYPFLLEVLDDYNNEMITSKDLTEIFKIIESYIFRRIMCGVATNALNKVFMNLCKEILTNSKVKGFSFMGIERTCKTWTELFEEVCKMLYDLDPFIFRKITKKDFGDEYLNKRFSSTNKDLRIEVKLAEDVYVEKNLNTNAKIYTLRIIFDEYGIDYNELSYYIE